MSKTKTAIFNEYFPLTATKKARLTVQTFVHNHYGAFVLVLFIVLFILSTFGNRLP